tara:strand:+ start:1983 stop:2447 length:465 start_codon:yes stop_codon:yes gene_type:complete
MCFVRKFHKFIYLFLTFFILIGCQLQEPYKNHGVVFLENRSEKLVNNYTNTNDVIKIFGHPHSKSINNNNEWFYIERILTKGKYHKLGKHVLKENNVLLLKFNKYGILEDKKILNKLDKNKVAFSKKKTENELSSKSFVERFLSSVKTKMYGNK